MSIHIDTDGRGKFVIKSSFEYNHLLSGFPDRRFRKGSRTWAVPALRRNIEFMEKNLNNPGMFTPEALALFNARRHELRQNAPAVRQQFPGGYPFKNPPMKHQMDSLNKYYSADTVGLFFEQGLGKTFTAINLVTAWHAANMIDAVIVICPSSIKMVWEDELAKHCPEKHSVHVLVAGKYKAADSWLTDRENPFPWLVVGIEGLSQGQAIQYAEKMALLRRCAVIVDESSNIKNDDSTRTDRAVAIGKNCVKRIILSGTAITQGLEDLYSQFRFLDEDILGYHSFYSFRNHFCHTISIEVARDRFRQKIVGYKNEDEFAQLIAPHCTRVEKKDAIDLPEKTFTNRMVKMGPKQKKLYSDMKHEMVAYIDGNEYEVENNLEQLLRLQQITGGFYPVEEGKEIVPAPIPGKNAKLEELMKLMDEISGKVIIWCIFRHEIEMLVEALSVDHEVVEFHGGCSEDEKKTAVRSLQEGTARIFIASRAAARGLTLTSASTCIYFSQNYSLDDYAQSQDRIHRIGQDRGCNYIHLLCEGTVDLDVINAVQGKQAVADMFYSILKGKS